MPNLNTAWAILSLMSYILVLPGLGDKKTQDKVHRITKRWKVQVPEVLFFDPKWHSEEPYEVKFRRLQDFAKTKDIEAVIGISAGASLAVNHFADNKQVRKVFLVAGKFHYSERIGKSFQERAPQLKPAVEASEMALDQLSQEDLSKIYSYRALFDGVIRASEMKIDGANNKLMFLIGHVVIIGYWLVTFPLRYRLVR